MTKTTPATRDLTYAVPLKLTPAVAEQVADAVKKTGLKKSDVLRLAVERGLSVLLAQLQTLPAADGAQAEGGAL